MPYSVSFHVLKHTRSWDGGNKFIVVYFLFISKKKNHLFFKLLSNGLKTTILSRYVFYSHGQLFNFNYWCRSNFVDTNRYLYSVFSEKRTQHIYTVAVNRIRKIWNQNKYIKSISQYIGLYTSNIRHDSDIVSN